MTISHTIKSRNRNRTLELEPENLLGFVEGDLYSDPIRASGELVGKFAAVETRDSKGDSTGASVRRDERPARSISSPIDRATRASDQ